jgi:hypothetical protein
VAKPTDVKRVTLTRSEWNLLDASISPEKRGQMQRVISKMMEQVGE